MKITFLVSLLVVLTIGSSLESPQEFPRSTYILSDGVRNKRSIGKFFSGFLKRFQKKDKRRVVYYHPPAYEGQYATAYSTQTYGPPPRPHHDEPYAAHHPSHVKPSGNGDSYGGSHGELHGHSLGAHSGGYEGGGHIEVHISEQNKHGKGQVGKFKNGGGSGHIPHGFGPLKKDDVIEVLNSGSYLPTAPHIAPDNYGAPTAIQPEQSYGTPPHGPVVPGSYVPPDPRIPGGGDFHVAPHVPTESGYNAPGGSAHIISDSYNAPNVPNFGTNSLGKESAVDAAYRPPVGSQPLPLSPHSDQGSVRIGHQGSTNTFLPTTYDSGDALPLATAGTYQQPSVSLGNHQQTSSARRNQQFILGGNNRGTVSYSSPLGPNDPIIEIVFQDADPLPRPPPPRIDPKLYEPPQDDVEVFFIEYSPEDNLNDLQSLDLKGAKPAILQNLPEELPYELRNELLTSGVLENANIEVINLENALKDKTLDSNTRKLLQNYYTRPRRHRDTKNVNHDSNTEEVRVRRIEHQPNTQEGVAEIINGLDKFTKGKFAGVVEVNDENSEKFLPFLVDRKRFPLPKTVSLEDKEVNGVLLLAPGENTENKHSRQNPFFITNQQRKPLALESGAKVVQEYKENNIKLDLGDLDISPWRPIVGS